MKRTHKQFSFYKRKFPDLALTRSIRFTKPTRLNHRNIINKYSFSPQKKKEKEKLIKIIVHQQHTTYKKIENRKFILLTKLQPNMNSLILSQ